MASDSLTPDELLEHFGFVRSLAAALVRDSDVAEDVAQNAMLAAMQGSRSKINGPRPWLRAVVRNLVRNHYRNEGRRRQHDVDYLRMDRTESANEDQMEVEKALERAEQRAVLVQAVMGLREPYRSVMVLRYFEEKSPKEVARVLDRPLETVQTQIRRGLAKLRVDLDERHGGDRAAWALLVAPLAGSQLRKATAATATAKAVGVAVLVAGAGVVAHDVSWWGSDRSAEAANGTLFDGIRRGAANDLPMDGPVPIIELPSAGADGRRPVDDDGRGATAAAAISRFQVTSADTGRGIAGARVSGHPMEPGLASGFADAADPFPIPTAGLFGLAAVEDHPESVEDADAYSGVTDADGYFELDEHRSGPFIWQISAPGHVRVCDVLEHDLVEAGHRIALATGAVLHLARGGAAPDGNLWVEVVNEFDGSSHYLSFGEGEDALTLDSLAPGPHELRAYTTLQSDGWGAADGSFSASVARAHRFVLTLDDPLTMDIYEAAGQSLTVRVGGLGAQDADASVQAGIELEGDDGTALHSVAERVGDEFRLKGLSVGPVEVQVLIGGEVVRQDRVLIAPSPDGETQVVEIDLQSGSVAIELREDDRPLRVDPLAVDAYFGELILYGPLRADEAKRQRLARPVQPTTFEGVSPGQYEVWLIRGESVWREVVEVGAGASTAMIDVAKPPRGMLSLRFDDWSQACDHLAIKAASGMEIVLPGISYPEMGEATSPQDWAQTAELLVKVPVGSYRIDGFRSLSGHPRANASAGKTARLRPNERPPFVSTQLIARVEGAPFTGGVLSIKSAKSHHLGPRAGRPVKFDPLGRATEMLPPGAYHAIDVLGRTGTFEVTETGGPVVIQLR